MHHFIISIMSTDDVGIVSDIAHAIGHAVPSVEGLLSWAVTATIDGVLGLILGVILVLVISFGVMPLLGKKQDAH